MMALSNKQKGIVCRLARRAFEETADRRPQTADFAQWRHQEQMAACGRGSLRACTQNDYARLLAHFYEILGETGLAYQWLVRGQNQGRRLAWHKLLEALTEFGFQRGYAEVICRRQYKCGLDDASPNQLWKLMYTVRNRGLARRAGSHTEATEITEDAEKVPF